MNFVKKFDVMPIDASSIGLGALIGVVVYIILSAVYNLNFHKLAHFPGPLLARSTLLWRTYHSQRGLLHYALDSAHKKYGPVVRLSPDALSFATVDSWKEIYGYRSSGEKQPPKGEWYAILGAPFGSDSIGSERDPARHGQMKKMMMGAFSTKALLEQEDIIDKAVDNFIARLGEVSASQGGLNMTMWFELIIFDNLGEMAFGESFQSVEMGKPHEWFSLFSQHLYVITFLDNLRRIPFLSAVLKRLLKSNMAMATEHSQYCRRKVEERLAKKTERRDFLSIVVREYEAGHIDKEEVAAHVSTLALAGGDTTAAILAAITYYLLRDPTCLKRLQEELDQAFPSFQSINATVARQLPYLQAVIDEGLRMYAPGSVGFPRVSTGMTVGGYYVPAGTEVSTHAWTLTHDEANFDSPNTFRPERWLDPESKDVKAASQPFSVGPRSCIGQNFALMELNLILAKMLWKYDMELLNTSLNWEKESQLHIAWWKPDLMVRFKNRRKDGN